MICCFITLRYPIFPQPKRAVVALNVILITMRFNLTSSAGILFMLVFTLSFSSGKAQTGILLNTDEAMPSYTLYESMPWV